jgi:hypothetical protein
MHAGGFRGGSAAVLSALSAATARYHIHVLRTGRPRLGADRRTRYRFRVYAIIGLEREFRWKKPPRERKQRDGRDVRYRAGIVAFHDVARARMVLR